MDYLQEHPDYVFQGGEHEGEDSDKDSTKSDETASTVDAKRLL